MIKNIFNWIKQHQLAAFFLLTFLITWGLGFSYGGFMQKGNELLFPLVSVATCGPALAGIIISAITNTEPKVGKHREFWIIFFVAMILSALVFLFQIIFSGQVEVSPMLVIFALIIVIPVAFVIGLTRSRIPAVRSYLSSLTRLRKVWVWVLLGFAIPILVMLLSMPISKIITGNLIFPGEISGFSSFSSLLPQNCNFGEYELIIIPIESSGHELSNNPLKTENIQYGSGNYPKVTMTIINTYSKSINDAVVSVLLFNDKDEIISGGLAYVDTIPANGIVEASVQVTSIGDEEPKRIEAYPALTTWTSIGD